MLLALDTSTRFVGMALYDGMQVLSELVWQSHSNHTVEVAPSLQRLLQRSQVKPEDLKVIAIALGPGSFTSLRIGLGLAKGLALALRIPMVGVPSFDILVAAQPVLPMPLATVLQAGRGRLALGWYFAKGSHWQPKGELQVVRIEELADQIVTPTLVCGELEAGERQLLARKRKLVLLASPAQSLRRPAILAELAWKRWRSGKVDDPVALAPIYVHMAEAIPA
ncbi:MAG: tRNA (adenosine(37)-N6)-threonylcarbamoyltransferase complex dimerization subunit type 1 TsaB [Anaerolineaceae bacterium]|nr:tRNA (adenosine(37)-N6)-threonylcarbamoyltransferase complex dimerization subunit type 1 TsaB [Anaerolineaceae bacterium]